jgi:hypothetical protein
MLDGEFCQDWSLCFVGCGSNRYRPNYLGLRTGASVEGVVKSNQASLETPPWGVVRSNYNRLVHEVGLQE